MPSPKALNKAKDEALKVAHERFPDADKFTLCWTAGSMMVEVWTDGHAQLVDVGVNVK